MKKYCRKSGQIYLILIVILQGKKYNKSIGKEYEKAGKTAEKQKGEEKICSYFIPRSMLVSAM